MTITTLGIRRTDKAGRECEQLIIGAEPTSGLPDISERHEAGGLEGLAGCGKNPPQIIRHIGHLVPRGLARAGLEAADLCAARLGIKLGRMKRRAAGPIDADQKDFHIGAPCERSKGCVSARRPCGAVRGNEALGLCAVQADGDIWVIASNRAGPLSERVGDKAHAKAVRQSRIMCGNRVLNCAPLILRTRFAVDEIGPSCILRKSRHSDQAPRPYTILQRFDHSARAADDGTDGTQGGMNEDTIALSNAEGGHILVQAVTGRGHLRHPGTIVIKPFG